MPAVLISSPNHQASVCNLSLGTFQECLGSSTPSKPCVLNLLAFAFRPFFVAFFMSSGVFGGIFVHRVGGVSVPAVLNPRHAASLGNVGLRGTMS